MNLQGEIQSAFGEDVELLGPGPDHSLHGVVPDLVAAPRTEAAARELVAWCGARKLALVPRGAGVHWHRGAAPERLDLVLSSLNLNTVFDHDAGNATVEAGAGITLAQLNEVVGASGQHLPLDLPQRSTLGGVVAANASGSWRHKYGTPRDMVTGLHVCLSDGRQLLTGAKVVKNVSGYDLPKVFTGSWGTLGFIQRVTIRVRPLDAKMLAWRGEYSSLEAAIGQAGELLRGPYDLVALRLILEGDRIQVTARFHGGERSVQSQIARLPGSLPMLLEKEVDSSVGWVLQASLPRDKCADWVQAAEAAGATRVTWDFGLGRVICALPEGLPVGTVQSLRKRAESAGGILVVDRCAPGHTGTELTWGPPPSGVGLMRKLKSTCDGPAIFSTGRYIGGM